MQVIIDGVEYTLVKKESNKTQLEDQNFRVSSNDWIKKIEGKKEYLESPTKDIWEILSGRYKGEQLFTWESAMREVEKAGKRLPTIDELSEAKVKNVKYVGGRYPSGSFINFGSVAYLWSSTQSGSPAWRRYLNSSGSTVYRNSNSKDFGLSVRCIKK